MGDIPIVQQIYWRGYCTALRNLVPGPLGSKGVFYVCPPNFRGITGGTWCPDAVTNNLLCNAAEDLLPADSPIYLPGGLAKYSQQLDL
jgi:hypothetical protein